ncbi:MAG: hypothetical protein MMC33_003317 [Icmadophila ericetorum]|nr:hypothetical protein [Icmadophila ericetorum]
MLNGYHPQVPLEYSFPLGSRASIPLIKLAADPDSKNSPYKDMILTNPGGPGVSGVYSVLIYCSLLQSVTGTNFDLVASDPRGIEYSLPSANYSSFPDAYSLRRRSAPFHGQKNVQSYWETTFANAETLDEECEAAIGGPEDSEENQEVENVTLVNYWGLSYGAFIGETLASMFSDRLGRVLLDGVVDPESWASGLYLRDILLTDDVISTFFDYCHLAGALNCSYYIGTTAKDIFLRFERILTQLNARNAAAQNLTNATIIETALEIFKKYRL